MQGYLAEVESKEENDFIMDTIAARGNAMHWLGGNLQEGVFRWSHSGRTFTYTNWMGGQPDNANNDQHCLRTVNDGTWDDLRCNHILFFICEMN